MLPPKVKHILWIFALSLAMLTPVFAGESWAGGDTPVQFTEQEKDWLAVHPVIVAAPDPDFPPVEYYDEKGSYRGIAADFVALIEKKLGIRFKIFRLKNWEQVLEKAKILQIDLVTAASRTPQREKYLQFTSSFIELPAVIIVRQKVTQNLTMENISGMEVAVVYRYAAHDFISNKYPDMDLNP
jgi:ABC-type amino acid transport substrate-binding protein